MKNYDSVLEEEQSFKKLRLTFSSKLNWGSCMISIPKTTSKKFGAFLLKLLYISINPPYNHAWNTAVMSELMFLVAT